VEEQNLSRKENSMEALIRNIIAAALAKDWILYAALKKEFYEAQRASGHGKELAIKAEREAHASGLATF
jgi:hypothetical protein